MLLRNNKLNMFFKQLHFCLFIFCNILCGSSSSAGLTKFFWTVVGYAKNIRRMVLSFWLCNFWLNVLWLKIIFMMLHQTVSQSSIKIKKNMNLPLGTCNCSFRPVLGYMVKICEKWNLSFKTFPQELMETLSDVKVQPDAEFSGISWCPF